MPDVAPERIRPVVYFVAASVIACVHRLVVFCTNMPRTFAALVKPDDRPRAAWVRTKEGSEI